MQTIKIIIFINLIKFLYKMESDDNEQNIDQPKNNPEPNIAELKFKNELNISNILESKYSKYCHLLTSDDKQQLYTYLNDVIVDEIHRFFYVKFRSAQTLEDIKLHFETSDETYNLDITNYEDLFSEFDSNIEDFYFNSLTDLKLTTYFYDYISTDKKTGRKFKRHIVSITK
jgi:hypothetical protein